MKRNLWLLGLIIFAGVTIALLAFLRPPEEKKQEVLPVSAVKEGYLACLEKGDEEAIGQCMDELASLMYGMHPISEIAAELDTLTLEQKMKWCHESMHYFGWRAYEEEKDIAKAFLKSSELCDSGMYHGVMEQFLREEGLGGNVEELVRDACTNSLVGRDDASDGLLFLCYHGMGHGLMYVTSSNLRQSLEICDVLGVEDAGACHSGAFMEHTVSKAVGPLANAREMTDFSYCNELNERHREGCFFRQGIDNYAATGGNMREAVKLCLKVPQEFQERCFVGIGANNPAPNKLHAKAGKECVEALDISEEAYLGCLSGSLGFVLQLEWGDMEAAVEFCNATAPEYMDQCYKYAGSNATPWLTATETKEKKCSVFEDPHAQAQCLAGIATKG